MPSRFHFVSMPVALAACLLGGIAVAMPVVQGPGGTFAVNDPVVFTVSDQTPADGLNTLFNVYLADFSFSYDPLALRYVRSDAVLLNSTLSGNPLPGDLVSGGTFGAQFIGDPGVTPAAGAALFTVSFLALKATGLGGTGLTVSSPLLGGAYGDMVSGGLVGAFSPTSGSVVVSGGPPSSVPEPDTWAMLLGGALVAGLTRRRPLPRA